MSIISNKKNLLALPFIITFVVLSMFSNWEMGGETWGYWYFAQIFKNTGNFIIFDRSPIYVLYLNLFNWLDYPYSVNIEYIFTTSICSYALFLFSRKFLNIPTSLIACCICIPFIQIAEPPVQKLALAFTIFSLLIRFNEDNRKAIMISYAFLLIAYCFRQTYLLFILVFLIFDIIHLYKQNKILNPRTFIPNLNSDWPLILVITLLSYFLLYQSPSNWNNVWFTDTTWFPSDGKTMRDGGGLQILNMFYILKTYGTYLGHDFYFTNKEAFNDAQDFMTAILANPLIFFEMVVFNITIFIPKLLHLLFIPQIDNWIFKVFYKVIITLAIFYGSLKFSLQKGVLKFFVGSWVLLLVLLIARPSERYFLPAIPIFILASCYYSDVLANILFFKDMKNKYRYVKKILYNLSFMIILLFLCFSNIDKWKIAINNFNIQLNGNNFELLANNNFSLKKSFEQLNNLSNHCTGLMALESLFLASFVNKNINYYSFYEIPPFGNLNNNKNSYNGLNLNRINCVFVSTSLEFGIGAGTNSQLRYKNYIKPYTILLLENGASKHVIPNFGTAFVLK